jgi:hypothetical protein
MATLTIRQNTTSPQSESKPCVWIIEKSNMLIGSVFINFESTQARDVLIGILREAFDKNVSFELLVDLDDINTPKQGSMSIRLDLEFVLDNMAVVARAVPKPVDAKVLSKADAFLADLGKMPKRVVVGGSVDDKDVLEF